METTQLNPSQIEYLLALLDDRARRLRGEYSSALKSKSIGIEVIHQIISAMEENNQLVSDLERMKKEV
jgi:hypothetical protein